MQHSQDTLDIALLHSDRQRFILKCQPIIEIVTKNFVRSGLFTPRQVRDVIQMINEQLITKLSNIERHYNGNVLMVTYMNAVIRNICLDIHKKERQPPPTIPLSETDQQSDGDTPFRTLMIQDELQRFIVVLTLMHRQRPKLVLCLKLYYRIPLTSKDVTDCIEPITQEELNTLISHFGHSYEDSLDTEVFTTIAPYLNKRENTLTSGDSLRRWTQENIAKIITLLNSGSTRRTHTKETVRILLDHYTQQFRL